MNPHRTAVPFTAAAAAVASALLIVVAGCSKPVTIEAPAVAVPAATPPAVVTDLELTNQVLAALKSDDTVKSLDIAVATVDGGVKLSGTLENQAQIDRALAVARAIQGVRNVENTLMLTR